MEIRIDKEDFVKDATDMLDINIHGHINSRYKEQRKPVVSKVGKECAKKIAEGLFAYLTAFEIKSTLSHEATKADIQQFLKDYFGYKTIEVGEKLARNLLSKFHITKR